MIGRTALVRTANRAVARRAQSTSSSPKMHRAKEAWSELEATRAPKDHDDLHVSVNELPMVLNTLIIQQFPYSKNPFRQTRLTRSFLSNLNFVLLVHSWSSTLLITLLSPLAWLSVLLSPGGASCSSVLLTSNTSRATGNRCIVAVGGALPFCCC